MHLTLQLEVLLQQWNITLGGKMSPANWIRQDEGEEVSWNCPWSRGREQRQLAVLGSSHPFLEQRCAVFPVDHWVPRGVAGKDGLGRIPFERAACLDPNRGRQWAASQDSQRDVGCRAMPWGGASLWMSAFGCQPRVRWPNENYKHPGGGCLLPSKPVSALVSNPKAAQSRGEEGLEQEQTSPPPSAGSQTSGLPELRARDEL